MGQDLDKDKESFLGFDGNWKVVWTNGLSSTITVENGQFYCFPFSYRIVKDEEGKPYFHWGIDGTKQWVKEETDLKNSYSLHQSCFTPGSVIVWETDNNDKSQRVIQWVKVE